MDKRTTPVKSFKDVVLEGKNRGKDIIGINYGVMEKKITENTTTTGEKKGRKLALRRMQIRMERMEKTRKTVTKSLKIRPRGKKEKEE